MLCDCGDIESCETERYVSDVRIAIRVIDRLQAQLDRLEVNV